MVILHTEDFMEQKFALMINVYNHDWFEIARDMKKCHLNLNKKCLYTLRENIPPLKPHFFKHLNFTLYDVHMTICTSMTGKAFLRISCNLQSVFT